jgi:hypothetical protein
MKKTTGKVLVFIIIGLFTGVSLVPSICGNITEVDSKKNFSENSQMWSARPMGVFDIPILTYAIMCDWVDNNGSHGPVKTQFLSGQQVYFYAELENVEVGDTFYGECLSPRNHLGLAYGLLNYTLQVLKSILALDQNSRLSTLLPIHQR